MEFKLEFKDALFKFLLATVGFSSCCDLKLCFDSMFFAFTLFKRFEKVKCFRTKVNCLKTKKNLHFYLTKIWLEVHIDIHFHS